ncbi:MAG: helix-turn-helix domain-containing protein, partial [Bacteroidota bacterium]
MLVGGLTVLVLLLSKYPSGRWLGFLLLICLVTLLLGASGNTSYVSVGIALISVALYFYLNAFFYQRRRVAYYHFLILLVPWGFPFILTDAQVLIWFLSGIIYFTYATLSIKFIAKERLVRGFSFFRNAGSRLTWLRNTITVVFFFTVSLVLDAGNWLSASLFLLTIGYLLFHFLDESTFLSPLPSGNKYKKSTLTPEIKSAIIDKLNHVMMEEQFYKEDDASLGKLASMIGASGHHLSQVLNESLRMSFQDLLAKYRIKKACQLLKEDEDGQLKIETIAGMVGYNSKSSFNTAFKKRTGLTPSEYRDTKGVRVYGEEPLSEREIRQKDASPSSLGSLFELKLNRTMILVSLRTLRKNGLNTTINILGFTLGIAACLTIAAYVQYEWSYDKHHKDANEIYRIALNRIYPESSKKWAITAPVLAPSITERIPEIQSYTRIMWENYMFAREGEKLNKARIYSIDSGFFDVFTPEVLSGAVDNSFFKGDDGIILTKTAAKRYFGNENAVGQFLSIKHPNDDVKRSMMVHAVLADPKPNSHFSYDVLSSIELLPYPDWIMNNNWGTWAVYSYIKVHPETNFTDLTAKINQISLENQGIGDDGFQSWLDAGNLYDYFLQPITDIHLGSNITAEFQANSSKTLVSFFAIVGIFILGMAIVNFVNLATARASYRTKEVGIRKAVGAGKRDLMIQFLTESLLICGVSFLLAIPVIQLFLPHF